MKGIITQLSAVLILCSGHFLTAYCLSWISYTAPLLESENSPLGVPATKNEINLLASVLLLGSVIAAPISGIIPQLIGRKNTELFSGILFLLTWSLIVTAKSLPQLIIARFIFGLGGSIHYTVVMMFINELSQSNFRGTMASIPPFSFSIGCLVSYISGWVCSYQVINYLNLSISVSFVVLVLFLKESPVYLLSKKKDKEALASLMFYRGSSKASVAILEEFEYLKKQSLSSSYTEVKNSEDLEKLDDIKEKDEDLPIPKEMSSWKILATSIVTQRAIIILASHVTLACFMGAIAVQTYASHFFMAAAPDLSPNLCSVILALSIVTGNGLAVACTDLVGRRILAVTSCFICTIALAVLVSLIRWSWAPEWTVPVVILLYCCAYQTGINNIPFVQMSESFMPQVKGLASSILITCACTFNFIVVFTFNIFVTNFGIDGTFMLFCAVSFVATVVTFLTVKETRGLPLEKIQGMYERGYFYWQ